MAHAYVPGLKVVPLTIVKKARQLPIKGEILKNVGEKVLAADEVAKTHLPGNIIPINIANKLNIEPVDIKDFMKKEEGDPIKKGEIIAETNGIFGLFKSAVNSPIDGTLDSFSHITGQAILRENPIPVAINAYVDGVVDEIIENEGVVVKTQAAFIQGIFGIGGERRGELKIVTSTQDIPIEEKMIDENCKDKIIVGGSFLTHSAFKKAIKVGVRGIVVGGFNYNDIKKIIGYDIGVAITGQEDIKTTLILTEGFGEIHMAKQTFELLKKHEGDVASINGATQIRAGVIRPEVIIPVKADQKEDSEKKEIIGMDIGTEVRIIRAPYFGMIGTVTGLPHKLQKLESGSMARVAKIKIGETQKEVLLPRANLEMIENK
ncbi:MAG: hypothetical protein PF551_08180 [Candidatus Marinimicrobia bacterium]|jgi:hypothetical protein|nr:hypothetical protein [Candidatus Neomarinimicrobiota bacterium]